ncbi:peptidoglycan-binding protein [Streptomyces sp. NPDC048337]|uniref:peptidoglycan-binding domain-containing protein n=1 Tax=Streptomyces sp. NPDC048337 TaxID=3365535 RepID=UPI0037197C66
MISARKGTLLLASMVLGGGLALGPAATSQAAAAGYSCNERVSNGYLYMGNSNTMTTNTERGQTGPRVAEVQCLLEFWAWYFQAPEFDPHGHDGSFGPNTERAVINAQKALFPDQPAEWDGEVGPKTWPAIRSIS